MFFNYLWLFYYYYSSFHPQLLQVWVITLIGQQEIIYQNWDPSDLLLNLITFHSFVISLMKCVSSGLRKHSYGQYPFIVIYSQLLLLGILNSRKITSLNQYYLSNLVFKSLQHHKHLFLILLTEITTKLPFPNFLWNWLFSRKISKFWNAILPKINLWNF